MTDSPPPLDLGPSDLRAVAGFAAACARPALAIFEAARPDDSRPRAAIDAAQAFADGAPRGKALRDAAWAAHQAARETPDPAAAQAARAAANAAGAAYLHPLAKATQVNHILRSAAHAARAFQLRAGGDADVGATHADRACALAPPRVADILRRYPPAPPGGGRIGELMRRLDAALR